MVCYIRKLSCDDYVVSQSINANKIFTQTVTSCMSHCIKKGLFSCEYNTATLSQTLTVELQLNILIASYLLLLL